MNGDSLELLLKLPDKDQIIVKLFRDLFGEIDVLNARIDKLKAELVQTKKQSKWEAYLTYLESKPYEKH